jgi:aminobenzoyl-glutamate utilization protein B
MDEHEEMTMRATRALLAAVLVLIAAGASGRGQDRSEAVLASIDANRDRYAEIARQIWDFAEVGYRETKSCALLQQHLRAAGFTVESGIAGIPTAFRASYGAGQPVIAILAEYDALPGISQDAVAERKPLPDKDASHACGHNLFGTGSVAAAIAVKEWLVRSGTKGTLRLYGTPAEEGGGAKVYMVRDGLFKDVDAVLHWHAGAKNDASAGSALSNMAAKFRFHGVSSHAAGAPERGRSALDGVEAMNHMANLMREHVPEDTRIHYVITSGGAAPNVVPDFAEVYYYVRHPDPKQVAEIFDRLVKAAQGAALGTGTTVDHEVINAVYSMLPNESLSRVMDRNLRKVGGVSYTTEERAFANRIRSTLGDNPPALEEASRIEPLGTREASGSTDVADVSWTVPTGGLYTATWVPGTPGHSWQATAASASSIGAKGMIVAAKTLALTAIDLFTDRQALADAKAEYRKRVGPDFTYRALVGDRKPPLDYRGKP